jgi:hypothetical protein
MCTHLFRVAKKPAAQPLFGNFNHPQERLRRVLLRSRTIERRAYTSMGWKLMPQITSRSASSPRIIRFASNATSARFPFTDLHSFKDYVVFVQTYLPNRFRPREGAGPTDQWTLDTHRHRLRKRAPPSP